ncbi:MAG: hydroxymyristoyl-ACP dehydratase [Legionellaceae bacterium]|nr:hydroxymyristoyl-ACP dehydratase [Legionellaceae bacterium]
MSFLFVDRILALSLGKDIQGLKHITHDDVYLSHDARGHYYLMPSVIGETLGQLAAWNVMLACDFKQRPVAGVVASVRPHRNVYIGETLLLESYIDSLDDAAVQYHSVARVDDEVVFTIDGALGPLLPMNDFIDTSLVKRQFAEINRPGEWSNVAFTGEYNVLLETPTPKSVVPLLFDRIIESQSGVLLRAAKRITRGAPYFPDHFPNKPVLPMTVLIECQLSLISEFLNRAGFGAGFAKQYHIQELRKIKMNDFVYPGDQVVCTVTVKHHQEDDLVLQYKTEVAGKRVCVMEAVLLAERGI